MKHFILILILAGFCSSGLWAQEGVNSKKPIKATDKMSLRLNTRDQMMICKGFGSHIQIRKRQITTLRRSQILRHQRMMQHQRRARQYPMRRYMYRRAQERQMMQQMRRHPDQQPNRPGGH